MGSQKEFIAQVGKLKKEFEFASELAININADRLKHIETISELTNKHQRAIKLLTKMVERFEGAAAMADQDIDLSLIKECKRFLKNDKSSDNDTEQ